MVWPLAIAAIAGAGLSYFGQQQANQANQDIASAANNFSAGQTQAQMDFQKAMYDEQTKRQWDFTSAAYDFNRHEAQLNRNFSWDSQQKAMDFQTQSQNSAMAYNTEMANTQMQRRMADLKAAGLNPMLGYTQGGASAPSVQGQSGPMASGTAASGAAGSPGGSPGGAAAQAKMAHFTNQLGPAVSSALQSASTVQNLENLAAQTDKIKADTAVSNSQANNLDTNSALQIAQTLIARDYTPRQIEQAISLSRALTHQSGATARNIQAQTVTEGERPAYVRESTREAGAAANRNIQENQQRQTYGPPGLISSTVGGISQITNSIWESIRRTLE